MSKCSNSKQGLVYILLVKKGNSDCLARGHTWHVEDVSNSALGLSYRHGILTIYDN